jgi:HK97 gp10 family phage protein
MSMVLADTFKVEGMEELFAQLNNLKQEIGKQKTDRIWREVVTRAAEPILAEVKASAPKDSGQLADRIYMRVRRPKARDKNGKYYLGEEYFARIIASPLRDDTRQHFVLNRRGKLQAVWRNKKPVAVSQEFGNARVAAQPFMRPGLMRARSQSVKIMGDILKLKIAEITRARNRAASKG